MLTEAQLQDDLKTAMKARATETVYALRGLITAIKNLKVEKQVAELPEPAIVALVRKEANKRSEASEFARKGNRQDLVDQNDREKVLRERYLPQQLTADELAAAIAQIAAELGSTQIGPIMAKLRERHAGRFDGKLARSEEHTSEL